MYIDRVDSFIRPFELKIGTPVTAVLVNAHVNFVSFSTPFVFELKA